MAGGSRNLEIIITSITQVQYIPFIGISNNHCWCQSTDKREEDILGDLQVHQQIYRSCGSNNNFYNQLFILIILHHDKRKTLLYLLVPGDLSRLAFLYHRLHLVDQLLLLIRLVQEVQGGRLNEICHKLKYHHDFESYSEDKNKAIFLSICVILLVI